MNKPNTSESVLVIGAGIAGIEAALNLANYGLKVYLVDDTPSIGGVMARLDKTFPTNDCSICIEAPKMYEVQKHPNIEILSNTDIRRVNAKNDEFQVRALQKARYVDSTKCKGCGKCIEACPLSVPDELDSKIGGERKLIYIPFPQAVPNVYAIDPKCRFGKLKEEGACVGGCIIDCIQCRECPIAKCVKACKDEGADAVVLWERDKPIDIYVKSIIVATGVDVLEPPQGFYGYNLYPNVITHMQFERLMNAGGPTQGEIIRPSDKKHPKRIAWIQCVGREKKVGVSYCSKVCCMIATKQNIIAQEHDNKAETFIFYNNLKTYGKGFHEFSQRAKELGVKYIKGKPSDVREDPKTKNLFVKYEDLETGKVSELEVNLLVLSTALVPGQRNKRLSKALKIDLDKDGFFKEVDPVNAPLETKIKGIYLCGGATGPIDISESVTQAIAASLKAAGPR